MSYCRFLVKGSDDCYYSVPEPMLVVLDMIAEKEEAGEDMTRAIKLLERYKVGGYGLEIVA